MIALLTSLIAAPQAQALPDNWLSCRAAAPDIGSLRRCADFRGDVGRCQDAREGGGQLGPVACLERVLADWDDAVLREDAELRARGTARDTSAWQAERTGICRDPGAIRSWSERGGEAHALFEAVRCELRQSIRRAIDGAATNLGMQ